MNGLDNLIEKIKLCKNIKDVGQRNLYASAIITEAFKLNGLKPPIIVGGQAVSFYTQGEYGTIDIDFVSYYEQKPYEIAKTLGFKAEGKDLYNEEIDVLIEFPDYNLEGSIEHIFEAEIDFGGDKYSIYFIGVEDIIIDRLCALKHWDDKASFVWAATIMGIHYDNIDWDYLKLASEKYGVSDKLSFVQKYVVDYVINDNKLTVDSVYHNFFKYK